MVKAGEESGKLEQLAEIRKISNLANFYFVRQKGPLGNATPIWNARDFVSDEPFLVLWVSNTDLMSGVKAVEKTPPIAAVF